MNIFSISFIFILILSFFLKYLYKDQWRNPFCKISGAIYFLIAALRGATVGGDSYQYVVMLKRIAENDLSYALNYYDKDPVFGGFVWIISRFTSSYTVLFTIVAALFVGSVWYYIYKYSKDPCLSIIFLLAFNLYQFSLTGMRQTIAMSLVVWAMIFLYEEKVKRAVIFTLIASLFHLSSLIFLFAILLRKFKYNINTLLFSVFAMVIVFLNRSRIAKLMIFLINDRGYEVADKNAGLTMLFVIFVLYVYCIGYSKNFLKEKNSNIQFLMAGLAMFFECLVPAQSIFFRLAFYFLFVNLSLIPNVTYGIGNKSNKNIVSLFLYLLLSAQYLMFTIGSSYILPYYTFWQLKGVY